MVVVVGVPGSGKTTLLRVMLRVFASRGSVYALDLFDAFPGRVVRAAPFPIARPSRPVVYRCDAPPYTKEVAAAALGFAQHVNLRGGCLFLDEVATCLDPRQSLAAPYARMAFQGRKHPPAAMAVAAQRLQLIHPMLRSAARCLYVFRQTSLRDVEILEESIPPPHGERVAALAPFLPDGAYLRVDLVGNPDPRPIPIRRLFTKRRRGLPLAEIERMALAGRDLPRLGT